LKEILEESAEEIYKKHKRESLVFYSYLKPSGNSLEIKLNLAYSRLVSGNEMKTVYGYPIILELDSNTTICDVYKIVAEMIGTPQEGIF
jgi:hypothetical protein